MSAPSEQPNPRPNAQPAPGHKPLMRSLGEFFGHIAKAVKADPGMSDPAKPAPGTTDRRVVSEHVEEREVPNPDGSGDKMILRRTVVEEVEIQRNTDKAP